MMVFLSAFVLRKAVLGACTMLYAGFSLDITAEELGAYVISWEIWKPARVDIYEAVEKGGAKRFWNWCEEQWKPYV
jgi:hypothetical protein